MYCAVPGSCWKDHKQMFSVIPLCLPPLRVEPTLFEKFGFQQTCSPSPSLLFSVSLFNMLFQQPFFGEHILSIPFFFLNVEFTSPQMYLKSSKRRNICTLAKRYMRYLCSTDVKSFQLKFFYDPYVAAYCCNL